MFRLYEIALDEYRFQVNLNWNRSQYLLGFNAAIIAVTVGLVQAEGAERLLPACLFALGAATSLLGLVAGWQQSGYYRTSRQLVIRLDDELGLGALGVRPTPGFQGDTPKGLRRLKQRRVIGLLFGLMIVINTIGAGYALLRDLPDPAPIEATP